MNAQTDTDLAKKIRIGNDRAFKEMYDRYHVQLYYIARQYLKSPELAEDAVQEVFVKLWVKRSGIDLSKSIKSYLFTILKNHLLNELRKKKEVLLCYHEVEEKQFQKKNGTSDQVIYNEYLDVVKKGMKGLTDREREIFELKSVKNYTNSEISELLDINIRTVKTHYYHSAKYIRSYLQKHSSISGLLLILLSTAFL